MSSFIKFYIYMKRCNIEYLCITMRTCTEYKLDSRSLVSKEDMEANAKDMF